MSTDELDSKDTKLNNRENLFVRYHFPGKSDKEAIAKQCVRFTCILELLGERERERDKVS